MLTEEEAKLELRALRDELELFIFLKGNVGLIKNDDGEFEVFDPENDGFFPIKKVEDRKVKHPLEITLIPYNENATEKVIKEFIDLLNTGILVMDIKSIKINRNPTIKEIINYGAPVWNDEKGILMCVNVE